MNFSLKVDVLPGGFFDLAGKTVVVSPRRREMLKDFSPVWQASIPAMRQNTSQVWNEGQSSWAPLRPGYLKWKAAHGYSTKKNVRTGKMVGAMSTGQINITGNLQWVWGIDTGNPMWYEGSKSAIAYPIKANERRPFMRLTAEFIGKLRDNFKDYLAKIFRRG